MEAKRCRHTQVQYTIGPLWKTPKMSFGLGTIQPQLTMSQVRHLHHGIHGCGQDLDFRAMCPSWTLRMTLFSDFRITKILIEDSGKLEIYNISFLLFLGGFVYLSPRH
jgi:hypothetical protein